MTLQCHVRESHGVSLVIIKYLILHLQHMLVELHPSFSPINTQPRPIRKPAAMDCSDLQLLLRQLIAEPLCCTAN